MANISAAMAKLAGLMKGVQEALSENVSRMSDPKNVEYRRSFASEKYGHYFQRVDEQLAILREGWPDLYADFQAIPKEPDLEMMSITPGQPNPKSFSRSQMQQLLRYVNEIFEIRAASEHASPLAKELPRRVFITHGRAKDWLEVQAYIVNDLELATLELAQEASLGNTIIEKLEANAETCDAAVIVMSGDDTDAAGQPRARENVLHEIGFFQSKYGRRNVVLLHEEGVSIPTNLGGIVYTPYPKGNVGAAFAVMARELKAIYKI